jgi:hypothetical protein
VNNWQINSIFNECESILMKTFFVEPQKANNNSDGKHKIIKIKLLFSPQQQQQHPKWI